VADTLQFKLSDGRQGRRTTAGKTIEIHVQGGENYIALIANKLNYKGAVSRQSIKRLGHHCGSEEAFCNCRR